MKTTNDAYQTIMERLMQIENVAVSGVLNGNSRDCCLKIKNLVYETRQDVRQSFLISNEKGENK